MSGAHFRPALFAFLRDLKDNNDRTWFEANKTRYEDEVREPALQFISDFGPRLRKISPHFDAIPKPVGGSLFRIHRDVRFGKDKSPYKTQVGIHFRHKQHQDAHAPGFYLHLEPGGVFAGCGIWRPDPAALKQIRQRLVKDPAGWRRATSDRAFTRHWELGGEQLARPPKGFDPEHPLAADLRRKDFIAGTTLRQSDTTRADFLDRFTERCQAGTPLMRWLCRALNVPF